MFPKRKTKVVVEIIVDSPTHAQMVVYQLKNYYKYVTVIEQNFVVIDERK